VTHQEIVFADKGRIELHALEASVPLQAGEVRGPTLCSLISPGTELAWAAEGPFPVRPGYAAVFRAEEFGSDVTGIAPGTLLLCMGPHRSVQQVEARYTVPLPAGLAPEEALLARLMGVSMTTLMTTTARPGDRVMVCGAGPVGFLAAQLFHLAGYEVMVVEPDEARRRDVEASGLTMTFARIPVDDPAICGSVALVVDCSGHEQSVLDACAVVRQHGEVVLVGVPWRRQTEIHAHALLDLVFRNFVVLRSGWEWELPLHAIGFQWEQLLAGYNNSAQSIFSGFAKALRWLAEGRIAVGGLLCTVDPRNAASVYGDLMHRRTRALFLVFDWSLPKAQGPG
jgi:threonine dehydrogenase-like Zn-dependent dehydrogenase